MNDVPSADLLARCRDDDAARELYRRYADRLVGLARARLSPAMRARLDPEDVALSAWRSFFELAAAGSVALRETGDLWRLLAKIVTRKACRSVRRQRAGLRDVGRDRPLQDVARGPTPDDAAALADELRCVLAPLDPVRRRVVELRLLGHDAEEIAAEVGRTSRTVRRVLAWLGEELTRRLGGAPPAEVPTTADYSEVVLERMIGQGGMGKVYRARWRGGAVAVKLLPRALRTHGPISARFLEEAATLARLRHRSIVEVRGLGRLPDGGHFLVMELVEGGDLASRLRAGPVPRADASRWVAEAAEAIAYAHAQGVVHCDLKPSNLLLGADGRVRVSDFGLARALGGRGGGGTPGFTAPELAGGGVAHERADVYGLGAVLSALLGGPDELCRRCLSADPAGRPGSAAEVAAALRG